MAEIVMFHSALGLRPSFLTQAEALRGDGHRVHTPDLFDGEVFDELSHGIAKRDALGIPELMRRVWMAVDGLPAELLYVGQSMGAASAQFLALQRPGALGAVLMHAALPLAAFEAETWPATVPLQLHYAKGDPWITASVVDGLEASVPGALLQVFRYEGQAHLFDDPDLPGYRPDAAAAMWERTREIARRLTSA